MKVLEIKGNHGYFNLNGNSNSIIDINKDNIFEILNVVFDNDEINLDEISEEKQILNDAEKIIYNSIYDYIISFISKKETIKKEISTEFIGLENLLKNESDSNE